ncbi:MAG: polymerase subunit gamma/tau [Clostridia bacterium]|nr:polymerase subunit gamma/tau [Clostridia bacterium]
MTQYQALYRQWRPSTFTEIVGQEHIVHTLLNALRTGRLVHAYLFCGPRGTGKTSTAKILAKAVNCQSPVNGEPCNKCSNCQRINAGNSLDVIEMDAASNRGIDEIRDLTEKIILGPVEGNYKVYIIDEVHMLTTEAFNALLKTLEEPPSHAIFILATTEPRKVLPTILSRCQRFDFHPLTASAIAGRLKEVVIANKMEIEPGALSLLSRKANGGLRDALSLLDQILANDSEEVITADYVAAILGTAGMETLSAIVDALANEDGAEMFRQIDKALSLGVEPQRLLIDLLDYTRNLLLLHMDPEAKEATGLLPEEAEQVADQARKFDNRRLLDLMKRLQQGESALRWSNHPRVLLEMTLAGYLVDPAPSDDLTYRVEQLEKRLKALEGEKQILSIKKPETLDEIQIDNYKSIVTQRQKERALIQRKGNEDQNSLSGKETTVKLSKNEIDNEGSLDSEEKLEKLSHKSEQANDSKTKSIETYVDLKTVEERWSEVLEAARQESVKLKAFLREGRPVAVSKGVLTIEVKTDFHRGMLEQFESKQKLEAVLKRVFNQPLKLMITGEKPSEHGISKDTIDEIINYFGKDKVEIKD